jgi:hypothetical protein
LVVKGNLYARDGSSPFVSTTGTFNVRIEMQTSNLIDQVSTGAAQPAAIWSHALDGTFTAEQILRIMAAALAGKVSGAEGTTVAFRDLNDTKDRIAATVDSNGNRTTVTLNGT